MYLVNAATLELEEFQSNKIPSYAILSHTWGNSKDEVTFRDISGSYTDSKHKPGFQKIEFCATQAMKDGFQYCWVDTCCIDKSSSAELSEAINSMFSWYKNSEICYVYMADVDAEQSALIDSQLENSRWFTRGWTLQELLAPRTCQFFDKTWTPIGILQKGTQDAAMRSGFIFDTNGTTSLPASSSQGFENQMAERNLVDIISRSTGIEESPLMRSDHSSDSLATRMSWASRRETTRVEDLAYCLLGIFDVNMPLLYGEGEKAFNRLQQEIIKMSTDDSIFAWSDEDRPNRKSFSSLLAPSPQGFSWILTQRADPFCFETDFTTYKMTNNGLRIELEISPVPNKSNEFIAKLGTTYLSGSLSQTSRCYIVVKLIPPSPGDITPLDSYVRVGLRTLARDPPTRFHPARIYVRQFINHEMVHPMYDRVSRVRFRTAFQAGIHWRGIVTRHQFDSENAVLFIEPGDAIDAKILLGLKGVRGGSLEPFGLRIEGDGTEYLESYLTRLASDFLEDLHRDDLEWKPMLDSPHGRMAVVMRFSILDGELEVQVILGYPGM